MHQGAFYLSYDTDATTYKYGRFTGPFPGAGAGGAKTTGSSTTVNAVTSGIGTFSALAEGDIIVFQKGETPHKRKVGASPAPNSITVDSAIDLDNSGAGYASWHFFKRNLGTTDDDGWLSCKNLVRKQLSLDVPTIGDAGGITFLLQGRLFGPSYAEARPNPIEILPEWAVAQASAPYTRVIDIAESFAAVRLGVKGTSGFAGTDVISAFLLGDPRRS